VKGAASARTSDGSPVELYKLLPAMGEPELIHSTIPAGATVLELGCGTGRITRELVALGHPVLAVDNSAEMLAEVRTGETILSDIERLHLGRTFDCVLLMSNLVNAADAQRRAFLRCCREHVTEGGVVLIERLDPRTRSGVFTGDYGPFQIEVEADREGDRVRGIVVYSLPDGRSWTHRFGRGGRILDDDALRAELREEKLDLVRVFGPKRRWCLGRPAGRYPSD
jgi:SAM-dependent methyltransferase